MHEEPLSGIKRKPKASINVAMDLVKKRRKLKFQPVTGAAMAAGLAPLRATGVDIEPLVRCFAGCQ